MFNRSITDPYQIPVDERRRVSTDICCTIIAAIFSLVLFSIAVINFNRDTTNDIYFANFSKIDGGISYGDYEGFKATLLFTFIITICLGIIWVLFVQFMPSKAPIITYILGIILSLFIGVASIFIQNTLFDSVILRVIFVIMSFAVAIILIASLCFYHQELEFQAILLKYSVRYLFESPKNFLNILLFLVLFCGLIVLLLFQHLGFSNVSHSSNNFFNFFNPGFLGILNVIEFIWGLQFLRDAFIFITSGNAVEWYWSSTYDEEQSPSFNRLVAKNWGSVVAGSFANAFLRIPSNIVEQFICHPNSYCHNCGQFCTNNCNWCISFFETIRTDSYSYINIFGSPYCDASRQCQKLCENSHHFVGFQSAMRNFRIVAGVVLIATSLILGYLILALRVQNINIFFAIDFFVIIIGTMSFFASIHPSIAEGIQTSFLVQAYLSSGYDYMQKCIPSFRKQLQALEKKGKEGHWS